MRILVTPTSLRPDASALEPLRDAGAELAFAGAGRPLREDELVGLLDGVDGAIAGLDQWGALVFDRASSLKALARYGAGYDRVDVGAATAHGVAVTATIGANAQAVAELAVGLMLAVARRLPALDAETRAGGWPRSQGIELGGRTLGLLGAGRIGRLVARAGQGLGMPVIAHDPVADPALLVEAGIRPVGLDGLWAASDVVSLHAPSMPSTHHVVDAAALAKMRRGAILVNTARGPLVDESALLAALESGHLAGAGIDVFDQEPPRPGGLLEHPSVVVTPHTGAHTVEAVSRMAEAAVQDLLLSLAGTAGPHLLNPEVFA